MFLAIVGADERKWNKDTELIAKEIIRIILLFCKNKYSYLTVISGGCPKGGIDIWVEEISSILGIPKNIYRPKINQWEDDGDLIGYKTRNIKIADVCDFLVDIEPKGRKRGGGIWTYNYAKSIGKKSLRIDVSIE